MQKFKKLFLFILIFGLVCFMTACDTAEDDPVLEHIEGEYNEDAPIVVTATAEAYGGPLTVEITVISGEIHSISVTDHNETSGFYQSAFEAIIPPILYGSLDVDAVSGATLTSNALIEAITAALIEAGIDVDAMRRVANPFGEADLTAIYKNTEVVVIGSGGAGMSVAMELQQEGIEVIVLEQMSFTGGNTRVAGSALNSINPDLQRYTEMGSTEMEFLLYLLSLDPVDDYMSRWLENVEEEFEAYLEAGYTHLFDSIYLHMIQTYYGGDFLANPALIESFIRESLDTVNLLNDLGVDWDPNIRSAVGSTWIRSHRPTGNFGGAGNDFIQPLIDIYLELGGILLTEHRAMELIVENDAVVGVTGETSAGAPFTIHADSVVIATGGFGYNVEMREYFNEFWPTLAAHIPTSNLPVSTGEGIMMARDAGANLIDMEWIQLLPGINGFGAGGDIMNAMFFNTDGERFVREDGRRDDLAYAVLSQPGGFAFAISDGAFIDDVLGGEIRATFTGEINSWGAARFMAETLEELAEILEVPYENLVESLAEFNEIVAGEKACPFGRQLFELPIGLQAPFFVLRGVPVVHYTMGGIEVNTSFQALNPQGEIIEGLFAVGEAIGGVHGTNRLGGNAITEVLTHGRILGQNLSGTR